MTALTLRPAAECRYDVVALGEVMLRLDPGEDRIRTARSFRAWEGGGEYNVARALRRTFGLRGAIVTALADNEVGHLVEDLILTGGLDTDLIRWAPFDGIGRRVRNGLNFTERGFGVRGAVGVSDRGHTAASQLRPDDVDWDHLFGELGVRSLHTGGIFAGLSESAAATVLAATAAARRHGTVVSYDLNYRPSLWAENGGRARALEVHRAVADQVDVLFDFTATAELGDGRPPLAELDDAAVCEIVGAVVAAHPNLRVLASTVRTVRSASVNDFGALAWSRETGLVRATHRPGLEVLDRVGGGDGLASGLIFGLLDGQDLQTAVEYGAAHGALAMTTPGDTSMATKAEVLALAAGGTAHAVR
ncbi:sugar kinase [Georgenia ruanii]|uniref:Sugar kinase n=1 Tax=Georgenia ruanii TaxID=348442 RepID=A0A7J9UW52_9MICO|nr:sugar kinase [Georgenia ruanii]MPV88851.1 sugar kinase [Georgenia ruanii]